MEESRPEDHVPEVLEELSPETLRRIIFEEPTKTADLFNRAYPEQIQDALVAISGAFDVLEEVQERAGPRERNAVIEGFLHSALYSLIAALHHLVAGYSVSCGNMMRHVHESLAMAMLCADKEAQVFEAFSIDPKRYRVDRTPDRLRRPKQQKRLREQLGIDAKSWGDHLDAHTDFEGRSHASALTLGFQAVLGGGGLVVVGGEFDPKKDHVYRADLSRITVLARDLATLGQNLAIVLEEGLS